jgi:hypothetical protein
MHSRACDGFQQETFRAGGVPAIDRMNGFLGRSTELYFGLTPFQGQIIHWNPEASHVVTAGGHSVDVSGERRLPTAEEWKNNRWLAVVSQRTQRVMALGLPFEGSKAILRRSEDAPDKCMTQ